VSTAEKIFQKAKALPEGAQAEVLSLVDRLARETAADGTGSPGAMTLQEAAELRGKLAAWEEDWNAPGMELYDRT
jgi:hypothetical protein